MAGWRFNPPPGWPVPPAGFRPSTGWRPDPRWPPAPPGWPWWIPDRPVAAKTRLTPGAKRVGLGLLVAAALIGALAVTMIVRTAGPTVWKALTGPSSQTPVDETRQLDSGRYVIFERTGTRTGIGGVTVTHNNGVTLTPDEVHVTGPDGTEVPVTRPTGNETINRNGRTYTGAVAFTAAHSGRYQISIHTAFSTQVIITRDFGATLLSIVGWAVALFASFALLVVGVVVLVRGKRRPANDQLVG